MLYHNIYRHNINTSCLQHQSFKLKTYKTNKNLQQHAHGIDS